MTPSGIEPATFRFVAQHLNHCATAVPSSSWLFILFGCLYYCISDILSYKHQIHPLTSHVGTEGAYMCTSNLYLTSELDGVVILKCTLTL